MIINIRFDKDCHLLQRFEAYTKDNRFKCYPILFEGLSRCQRTSLSCLVIFQKNTGGVENVEDHDQIDSFEIGFDPIIL